MELGHISVNVKPLVVGAGIELVAWLVPMKWPDAAPSDPWLSFFLVAGALLIVYGLVPVRHTTILVLPIAQIAARLGRARLLDWVDWKRYAPELTVTDRAQTHYLVTDGKANHCRLYLDLEFRARHPYADTTPRIAGSWIEVKQKRAGRAHVWIFHPFGAAIIDQDSVRVRTGDRFEARADYRWDNEGISAENGPDLDLEFSWELKNVGARFMTVRPLVGKYPTIKRRHVGRRPG